MTKKRLADELIRNLTDLRDALREGRPIKQTVVVKCEKCGEPGRAKEMRGGWCWKCNHEAEKK